MEGPSSRRCLGNGEWEGEEPYCRGKDLYYHTQRGLGFLYKPFSAYRKQAPIFNQIYFSTEKNVKIKHYTPLSGFVLFVFMVFNS